MDKGVVYYTCNTHIQEIEDACRAQLLKCDMPILSVSLNKQIDFGDIRITMFGERGAKTMHKQILEGIKNAPWDIVFMCENDVLYHPTHFEFVPPRKTVFYYNTNVWKVRYSDGHAVWTDDLQQLSGLCAYRELLDKFYSRRVDQIEKEGFNRHFEPGHKLGKWQSDNWVSQYPNIDIRHNGTLTKSKWSPDEFRNKQYAKGWAEASSVAGWGVTEGRLEELLREIS